MNNPKYIALLDDKEFVVKMMSQETPEDVQKVFADHGVEITMEEVKELGKALAHLEKKGVSDELSEDDLMDVAGGFLGITAAGLIAAGKIVVAVGGLALSVYKWYKSR